MIVTAEAQQVLDQLERDLQCVIRRPGSSVWLTVQLRDDRTELHDRFAWLFDQPPTGSLKPSGAISLDAWGEHGGTPGRLGVARFGLGGAWLRLVVLGSDGRPQAVAYEIQRRFAGSGSPAAPRYCLMRPAMPATLATGVDLAGTWSETLAQPEATDLLAAGVVDFGIWLGRRPNAAGEDLARVFPRSDADVDEYSAIGAPASDSSDHNPDFADVLVRLLTPEGERLVQGLETGAGRAIPASDAEWWAVVTAHSLVFTRRVEFKSDRW
jgi:hypothetical protein